MTIQGGDPLNPIYTAAGSNAPGSNATHPIYTTPAGGSADRTILKASGTAAGNGNNTLIAAPVAGVKIVLTAVVLQNESAVATTMQLQDGVGGTTILRCLGQNQGDGLAMVFNGDARPKLTNATPLNLFLSGANSCGYSILYYTE